MSVLNRDIASYQSALDQYRRVQGTYNRGVDAYNKTLVSDADGNLLIVDSAGGVQKVGAGGVVSSGSLPSGTVLDYGRTAIPDEGRFTQLRQNPTTASRESINGVTFVSPSQDEGIRHGYAAADGRLLGSEWRQGAMTPGQRFNQGSDNEYQSPDTYEFSRDTSTYLDKPEEWTRTFTKIAPDPTFAAARRANKPSLAQFESGLIGQVITRRGPSVAQGR